MLITLNRHRHVFTFRVLCCSLSIVAWLYSHAVHGTVLNAQQNSGQSISSYRPFRTVRHLGSSPAKLSFPTVTLSDEEVQANDNLNKAGLHWSPYKRYNDAKKKTGLTLYRGAQTENIEKCTHVQIYDDASLYMRDAIIRINGTVECTWSPTPPFSVTIIVEDENNYTYIGRPTETSDCATFFQQLMDAQYSSNRSLRSNITRVNREFAEVTYELVHQYDKGLAQIQLWRVSPRYPTFVHEVELVTKKEKAQTTRLEKVSIHKNGQTSLTWSTDLSSLDIAITAEKDNGWYAVEVEPSDRRTEFFKKVVMAVDTPDTSLLPMVFQITMKVSQRTLYLIQQFNDVSGLIQLWSMSPIETQDGNQVDVVTQTANNRLVFLQEVSIERNGQTKLLWSTEPHFSVDVIVKMEIANYVAQSDNWTKFYRRALKAQETPDSSLFSLIKQKTQEIDGETYYCFFTLSVVETGDYGRTYVAPHRLWSRSPMESEHGQRADMVTKKMEDQLEYLLYVHVGTNGQVYLRWQTTPVVSVPIHLEIIFEGTKRNTRAELSKSESWVGFYKKLILAQHTADLSLPGTLKPVTLKVNNKTYYLVAQSYHSTVRIQSWSLLPGATFDSPEGYLITRTVGTKTEYLKEAIIFPSGTKTNTWVNSPVPSSIFYYIHEPGDRTIDDTLKPSDDDIRTPTSDDVFDYIAFDNAQTTPAPAHTGTKDKQDDHNPAIIPKPEDGSTTTRSSTALPVVTSTAVTVNLVVMRATIMLMITKIFLD